MRWLERYRLLLVLFTVGTLVGIREYVISRESEIGGPSSCEASAASCFSIRSSALATQDPTFWTQHATMVDVVAELNPDDPDTGFLKGMQALASGDEEEFIRRFEHAIETGAKHNPMLLQFYAQVLLDRGADWQRVNHAINVWRKNHQFSPETISLNLSAGPRTASDQAALRRALARIGWIEDARLERSAESDSAQWRLHIAFRPGRVVDMRDAVAAVTVLAIPEHQRDEYEVTCRTLIDCTATRISRR